MLCAKIIHLCTYLFFVNAKAILSKIQSFNNFKLICNNAFALKQQFDPHKKIKKYLLDFLYFSDVNRFDDEFVRFSSLELVSVCLGGL